MREESESFAPDIFLNDAPIQNLTNCPCQTKFPELTNRSLPPCRDVFADEQPSEFDLELFPSECASNELSFIADDHSWEVCRDRSAFDDTIEGQLFLLVLRLGETRYLAMIRSLRTPLPLRARKYFRARWGVIPCIDRSLSYSPTHPNELFS